MRSFFVIIICLSMLSLSSLADVPAISMPDSLDVLGNGLYSVAFVIGQSAISPEAERSLRYNFYGFPEDNPPVFDETSKLFFWRPNVSQAGAHTYNLIVKDPLGNQTSESVTINVLVAPTPEALPKRWEDFKDPEKYLKGRDLLPSSNIIDVDIVARPDYEIEIKVKDSMGQDCILVYVPKEGRDSVSDKQRKAVIMLGGNT
ncbi:MAG: hypothetical protein ABIA67_03035 [Candidatus Margulisiibacteriota bacterium]